MREGAQDSPSTPMPTGELSINNEYTSLEDQPLSGRKNRGGHFSDEDFSSFLTRQSRSNAMVACLAPLPHRYLLHFTLILQFLIHNQVSCKESEKERFYTNGWAIQVPAEDGYKIAKRIAEKYGFEKVEKIGTLPGYFHLEHPKHPSRSKRSSVDRTELLQGEEEVVWVEQQHEKKRNKRGFHHERVVARGITPRFADPLWDEQWYLDDKRNTLDLDINVIPVWNKGVTGKGVVVTILDDGIEHNHTDIERNYDPAASWDVNDNDPDPFPRYDVTNENKHGTRCAGEVAAEANNSKCGVGVAYGSRIGGVRMLDGRVTDRVEAESLSLNPQYIDIYSASWGPSDDGMTVEGPGTLAMAAFLNGITKGRGGLGAIYVWASGNGGRHDDSCNCDGYTASIYTLSISSSSDHGESPWYSEACSSTLATTLSSGAHGEKRIVTTDLHNQCTERHTGTSASAPLAAGIIALALEMNPKLTWRDVQHIVVHTANWLPLKHDPDWRMNGVGLHVNEKFGFGLLDAEKIVDKADPKTWKTVPEKQECRGKTYSDSRSLRWDQPLTIEIESDGCKGTKDEIRYVEHVQVVISLDYNRRGDLTIHLTTPMGTRSCLLPTRSEDSSDEGFKKWAFMTTHAWGEDPRGKWTMEIKDAGDSRANVGTLHDWQLIIHGTKEKPNHQKIAHPEVPIHRKAVPDDVKATQGNQQPSVTITKVTYTFGQQPLNSAQFQRRPEQSISPLPGTYPPAQTPPIQGLSGAVESTGFTTNTGYPVHNYPNVNNASPQRFGSAGVLGAQTYPIQNYRTNPFPYGDVRSNIPYNNGLQNYGNSYNQQNFVPQNVVSYFSNQNSGATPPLSINPPMSSRSSSSYEYRELKWDSPSSIHIYADPQANLWDFFGRVAKRRRRSDSNIVQTDTSNKLARKTVKNSLIEKVSDIRERLKRKYSKVQ